jgi:chromosome segregation ATPase
MASNSHPTPLTQAFDSLSRALQRLEAAASISAAKVQTSAAARESAQSEITLSWQQHCATVESERDTLAEENHFLKEDNLRLSNQLQALQDEYLALQQTAGHVIQRLDGAISQLDLLKEH